MNQHQKRLQEAHEKLREYLFEELWNHSNRPLTPLYTLESLPRFEKGLLKDFSQHHPLLPHIVFVYAFYLGETIVKEFPNAEWSYPKDGDPELCKVVIEKEKGVSELIPFNTIFKLATGLSHDLMSIVEAIRFMMENSQMHEQMEKGKKTQLPNGAVIRVMPMENL